MGGGRRRLPPSLRRPEVPIVLGVFLVLAAFDLVAPLPWWALVLVVLGAALLSDVSTWLWPTASEGRELWLRTATLAVVVTAVMYATGWVLAVGYVFVLGEGVRRAGSRACTPALVSSLICLLGGQVLVALEVVPTMIDPRDSHGYALLGALGLVIVVAVVRRALRSEEQADEELRRREERFRSLLSNASDVILVLRPDGTATYVSPAFERSFGAHPGTPFQLPDFVHPDDTERAREFFEEVMEDSSRSHWNEVRLRDARGDWHWFEVWLTNRLEDPVVGGIVANLRDITDRKLFEEQLQYQAYHDDLTGLPNRAAFLERLQAALGHPVNRRRTLAVLFLDIDRFKLVNDSLGHDVGDRLLCVIAERLRVCLRPADVVARFGGDEFTILLTDLDAVEGAGKVADRILDSLHGPVAMVGRELFVTGSIGIAIANGDARAVEAGDLLRHADLAMYLAKERGRARWELFDPQDMPQVVERLELEGALWRAVDEGELVVYFQPEVALDGGDLVALEALVRWDHPRRGILLPGAFVPFAEESSLIVAIDRYVLRQACRQAAEWQRRRPGGEAPTVSVNLSPRFVHQPDAVDDVLNVIRETDVDPGMLQVEITERTALSDRDRTFRTLQQLRALGIRVAIDDFGTGYSSLSYLRHFPVDVLKLDKSFIDGIGSLESGAAIVEAVITMGHALGMRVTAEGVERADQAAELRRLGCDAAQGFHFARPLAVSALEELLAARALDLGGTVVELPVRRGAVS